MLRLCSDLSRNSFSGPIPSQLLNAPLTYLYGVIVQCCAHKPIAISHPTSSPAPFQLVSSILP